jgi:hypothetical protein
MINNRNETWIKRRKKRRGFFVVITVSVKLINSYRGVVGQLVFYGLLVLVFVGLGYLVFAG